MCRGRLLPHHSLSGNRGLGGPPACPTHVAVGSAFWQEGAFSELQAELEEPSFPQPRAGCESHMSPVFLEVWGWEAAAALPSPTAFCPLPSPFPDTVPI